MDVYGRERIPLLTAEESAAMDRLAAERAGVPERVLMENAGRAAAAIVDRLYPRGRVVAVVGSGNNGGDALVLARALHCWGRNVAFVAVGSRPPDRSLLNGFPVEEIPAAQGPAALARADVVVDGVLGTGATGAPRGGAAQAIEWMNACGRPVVALDIPSGVDATTGEVHALAAAAAVTITFGWPKRGTLLFPGRAACGRLIAVEIGFPPWLLDDPLGAELITPAWAAARLPRLRADAHKGTAGRLLVLAGSVGMAGAAALAGKAAVRAGAGLVRLASPGANRTILQTLVPEAVYVDRDDAAALEAACADASAVVAGPGLGRDDAAVAALERVLAATEGVPTLLDADALNVLAGREGALARAASARPLVITPHPGEMSRLTGDPIARIQQARIESASALAERTGCVVLLKGAPSVVAAPGEPVLVNTVGSSDVAKAGMGDHLSGVIGALLAAGLAPRDAAAAGLFVSGRAAELAAKGRALSPADATEALERALRAPGPPAPPLTLPFITFDQPARR